MPKLSENKLPAYRRHKQSGRGIVTLSGKDFLLPGDYRSPASKAEYNRLTAEWMTNGRNLPREVKDLTVDEIAARFWKHVTAYYRKPDGSPTSEVDNFRDALRQLLKLYGSTEATHFGPLALDAVRSEMIRLGWARTTINRAVGRLKLMFKWTASKQLTPASVYHGLITVSGLKAGRSEARESKPVRPVAEDHARAILQHVAPPVQAMIELQLHTGMRPGEVTIMRTADIDTTGKLWLYKPTHHKSSHRGHERIVFMGPRAQEIVRPFLRTDLASFIFSPADAMDWHREQRRLARETPLHLGNVAGSNRQAKPRKAPGDHYAVEAYAKAIYAGCDRAFPVPDEMKATLQKTKADLNEIPQDDARREAGEKNLTRAMAAVKQWKREHRWHPHQLRHTAATKIRKEFGAEAARTILGHKHLLTTEIYAEKDIEAAQAIVGKVG